MNTKKGKIVWFLYVVLLVFLFLASSTDLIIKEKKNEISNFRCDRGYG